MASLEFLRPGKILFGNPVEARKILARIIRRVESLRAGRNLRPCFAVHGAHPAAREIPGSHGEPVFR